MPTSISTALRRPDVSRILLGIETFNATALDRRSSHHHALILAEQLGIAQTGSSDAHVVEAVGLCATGFEGHTARDLLKALDEKKTFIYKQKEWNSTRILGSWVTSYVASTYTRIVNAV